MNMFQNKVATKKNGHTDASSRFDILPHFQNPAKSKGSQRYFLFFLGGAKPSTTSTMFVRPKGVHFASMSGKWKLA